MSEIENHDQTMLAIGELKGLIVGITQRLDGQNGRLSKSEGKIDLIEKQQSRSDGRLTAYGWIFGGLIGIGGIVVGLMQFYIANKK